MMGATSSVLLLADLALTWDNKVGAADLSLIDLDLASDAGLETADLLSLFTDRRAFDDDDPPSGDPADRRGWWGDAFGDVEGDLYGSRLWLLDRANATEQTARRAEEYAREALQWQIDDSVVQSNDVEITLGTDRMLITITHHRPGRDPVTFRFAHVWDSIT